jgi:hypothetical protein
MKNKYLLRAPEGMEGQAPGGQAPVEQSTQAPSAPEPSNGQGINQDYLKRLEEQNLHAQQKITQFGQQSAELKRQLEQMQQAEELRKQQMLAAYGVKQDAVEPDVIDRMMQDPKYLDNLIENRVRSAVDPIKAERDRERLNANLQSEISKKASIKEQLSKEYSKEIVEQLTDFNQMFPDLSQKQQQLNQALQYGSINSSEAQKIADAIDSELYKRIEFYGGLEGVVDRQLGTMFRSNKDTLMRDAMQQERQRQLLNNRNRPMNSFSNSAPGDDLNNVGYKRRVGTARVVSN